MSFFTNCMRSISVVICVFYIFCVIVKFVLREYILDELDWSSNVQLKNKIIYLNKFSRKKWHYTKNVLFYNCQRGRNMLRFSLKCYGINELKLYKSYKLCCMYCFLSFPFIFLVRSTYYLSYIILISCHPILLNDIHVWSKRFENTDK